MQEIIADALVAYWYLACQRSANPDLLAPQPGRAVLALQIVKHQSPYREVGPWTDW
jgi:hypothetical protein